MFTQFADSGINTPGGFSFLNFKFELCEFVTKIVKETQKAENKNLRSDGTTASRKEKREKELEELNKLLAELGTVSSEPQAEAIESSNKNEDKKEENKTQGKGKKVKTNKKEIFENVRSEIAARGDKSKKNKKKEKFHNY